MIVLLEELHLEEISEDFLTTKGIVWYPFSGASWDRWQRALWVTELNLVSTQIRMVAWFRVMAILRNSTVRSTS